MVRASQVAAGVSIFASLSLVPMFRAELGQRALFLGVEKGRGKVHLKGYLRAKTAIQFLWGRNVRRWLVLLRTPGIPRGLRFQLGQL